MLDIAWKYENEILEAIKKMPNERLLQANRARFKGVNNRIENEYCYVSIDREVKALYQTEIDYKNNIIDNLGVIVFDEGYNCDYDFMQVLYKLLIKQDFRKIKFWTEWGSKSYFKLMKLEKLCNVREVGIFEGEWLDIENKPMNIIYFELTQENFMKSKIYSRKSLTDIK